MFTLAGDSLRESAGVFIQSLYLWRRQEEVGSRHCETLHSHRYDSSMETPGSLLAPPSRGLCQGCQQEPARLGRTVPR